MKRFNVKWSKLYQAYCIFDCKTKKIVHQTDNIDFENAQYQCNDFNSEYYKTGKITAYGI